MTEEMDLERSFSLAEGEAFKAGSLAEMEVEGDYTHLDFGELADQYKLSDAYKNVRNLELRSETEIELQTFAEYRDIRAPAIRAPFEVERKRRPRYPADEGYRNRKLRHLYRYGDMLVMVDRTVYDAVAGSIDQYVLDVGRVQRRVLESQEGTMSFAPRFAPGHPVEARHIHGPHEQQGRLLQRVFREMQ